jgi:multimeric flavodoxin WrbA
MLTIILDLLFRRTPWIEPLDKAPREYDHIIFVAPVWDSKVANPMQALIKRERENISRYSLEVLETSGQHRA